MANGTATISLNVDGADASRRQIETVGDALQKMDRTSLAGLSSKMTSLTDSLGGLKSTVGAAAGALAGFATVGAFAGWIKGAIDATDAADDLSQKTGIAVQDLAGLELAFQKGGMQADDLEGAMSKLSSRIVGNSDAFGKLGLETKLINGDFKTNKQMLYELSDQFASMGNGVQKAALAQDLFGKSGAAMIPMLNEGSAGLRELDTLAHKLGLSLSQEAVDSAGQFNDTLDVLKMGGQGVARQIAAELLPTLSKLSGEFLTTMTKGDALKNTAMFLATGLRGLYTAGVAIVEVFSTVGKTVGAAGAQLVSLLQGEFKQAAEIGRLWREDIGNSWTATLNTIEAAWDSSSNASVDAMAKIVRQSKVVGLSAAEVAKQAKEAAKAQNQEIAGRKEMADFNQRYLAALDSIGGMYAKTIEAAESEAASNERLVLTYGKTTTEIERLELARLEEQLAQRSSLGLTLVEIDTLEKLIAAKKRNATALGTIDSLDGGKKALDDLYNFLDPARAQSFGEALRESFGSAGDALSKLTSSLDGFGRRQAEIAKHRETAEKNRGKGDFSELKYLKAVAELNERETKNRLAGYGDMASAAAGFFGEQSRGYQTLMTVSKIFHAAELAMTMAELVPKGIAAVLTQGTGDPYTAFGRMASMAAIVAGLGVAIGGVSGSGPSRSESRQKDQGTGTVLGSDAKSESIAKSLDMIERATFQDLSISTGMLQSLRAIESNIGNFASLVVRTTGLSGEVPNNGLLKGGTVDNKAFGSAATLGGAIGGGMFGMAAGGAMTMGVTGSMSTTMLGALGGPIGLVAGALLGAVLGKTIGKISSKVFGGQQFLEDTGLSLGKTSLATVAAGGLQAQKFDEIKKKGGWFKSDKYRTEYSNLGSEANRQFSQIIMSMANTIEMAAVGIGLNGDEFSQKLDRFVVSIDKISLKGKSGEEIEKELEAVFSKLGDDMARFGIAGLEQFQQVGEGYLETLTRVSVGYQTVDAVVQSLGLSFQSVGYGSITARERLIELAGGLDEFTSVSEKFLADFYTDQERADSLRARIAPTLDQYGIKTGTEDALQQFRNVVKGLDLTTSAGAQAYAVLTQIAPAFKQIADLDAERFEERAKLQDEYDKLTMSSAQLLAKQRDALHESNRALFDQVQAVQKVKDAQDNAKSSLGNFLSQMKSFAATAAGLNNNLVLGSMSVLTPEQQYAEARRQFEETRRLASVGDSTAQGNLQSIEQTFLQLSQKINGGDAQYSSDLATVIRTNDELSKWATDSVDVAQASLDALNNQVSSLNDIGATLKAIAESVQHTPVGYSADSSGFNGFAPNVDYSQMGSMSMAPLVEEIKAMRQENKALREEVKALRTEAAEHARNQILNNAQVTREAADTVVTGAREAAVDHAYATANRQRVPR